MSMLFTTTTLMFGMLANTPGSNFVRNTRATGVALYSTAKQTHVLGRHKGAI